MGTNKAFPLEGKVGPKDPDEGEPAAAPLQGATAISGTATGEKQINNFLRLYVENRPALHGLHFSFVAEQIFPSSVSSADSFPSGGKPFMTSVNKGQIFSLNCCT